MAKYHLNPLPNPPRAFPIVAFDVEGTGEPDGFLLGVIYDKDGPHVYYDPLAMSEALLSHKYRSARLFAHNLEYDWGILFQDDMPGWSVYRLRSRLIKCVYRDDYGHSWRFWDTTNLSAFQSVAALGRILGMDKYPTPSYIKTDGQSSITHAKLSDAQWGELTRYCVRDAEIVYRYAEHLQEVVNTLGGKLRPTLASTAMDLFRRAFLDQSYHTPFPWQNELCRQAYYGGRTEVFRYGKGEGMYEFDVHSMYPFVMSYVKLPDPNKLYHVKRSCKERYIFEMEGVTNATVTCPDQHVPILPTRISGRLLFTTGSFTGTWCHNELRFALSCGYRLDAIHWQMVAPDHCNPLFSYVDALYAHKLDAQANGSPSYFIYKILLNSLYGKFGQRCDGALTRLRPISDISDFKHKVGLDVIEWQGEWYINQPIAPTIQPDYVIVLWAAYVTAEARLRLWDMLMRQGKDVVYCDTDCVVGPVELPTDPALGGLGKEFGPVEFDVRAEKYYRWREEGQEWKYRKAGVPRTQQARFWEDGKAAYPRPRKIGEAMRSDKRVSTWLTQVKTDLPRHMKRRPDTNLWPIKGMVNTRPWTYQEAVEVYENAPRLIPWRDRALVSEEVAEKREAAFLDAWQRDQQVAALREACIVPAEVVFKLWDFRTGAPRRIRNRNGELTTWDKAQVDDLATELGFTDAQAILSAVRQQVALYTRIRRLRNEGKAL